jgi:hypothetical protein
MADVGNHPKHYNKGKIEVIDFIEDQQLDFHIATAVQYICRAGFKEEPGMSLEEKEIQDLEKALWYIKRKIRLLRRKQNVHSNNSTNKASTSN